MGNTTPFYSQSGELRVALEKQFREDLEFILVQAPEGGKKNEKMSRGHETGSRVFTDTPSANRSTGIKRLLDLSTWDAQHV